MMIYAGGSPVSEVYIGTTPVVAVYAGTEKLWPLDTPDPEPSWVFFDDFNRSTIGSAWSGSGGLIDAGALKKNTAEGSADYWLVQQFASDDLDVTATLGPVQDAQQRASILLGSPTRYVYVEFAKDSGIIGDYNGASWVGRAQLGAQPWAAGDTIRVRRIGSVVTVYRNGSVIASATSSVGIGSAHRRIGLSVRMDNNLFVNWYGPTFDSVGVRYA